MITNIYVDCLPFLSLAVVILLGFGLALYVLLHEDIAGLEDDALSLSHGNILKSILTLFYAVLGEFEPEVHPIHHPTERCIPLFV